MFSRFSGLRVDPGRQFCRPGQFSLKLIKILTQNLYKDIMQLCQEACQCGNSAAKDPNPRKRSKSITNKILLDLDRQQFRKNVMVKVC
jgi:hypothetical protein